MVNRENTLSQKLKKSHLMMVNMGEFIITVVEVRPNRKRGNMGNTRNRKWRLTRELEYSVTKMHHVCIDLNKKICNALLRNRD
jgi:hypothetical protein